MLARFSNALRRNRADNQNNNSHRVSDVEEGNEAPRHSNRRAASTGTPARLPHHVTRTDLKLLDLPSLRIGNEPNHRLVNIPVPGNRRSRLPAAPVDTQTDSLRGRAYLEALSTDNRLLTGIQDYLSGEHCLASGEITAEGYGKLAERLRPIVGQASLLQNSSE